MSVNSKWCKLDARAIVVEIMRYASLTNHLENKLQ